MRKVWYCICFLLCLFIFGCNSISDSDNFGEKEDDNVIEDNKEYVTITFDSNGGSGIESVKIKKETVIPLPNNPTKEGYTFDGWYYADEKWSFKNDVAFFNITLTAKWKANIYKLKYYEYNVLIKELSVEYGSMVVLNCDSDDYFYKFLGDFSKYKSGDEINYDYDKDLEINVIGYDNIDKYSYTLDKSKKTIEIKSANCSDLTISKLCNEYSIDDEIYSVTSIGDSAFSNCKSLTSITIPDSVTSIGNYAFFYCKSLTDITIPDSVTSIGNHAFYNCSSLTSISIPEGVTSIGTATFADCTSLTSVTIPNSVTSIASGAFARCPIENATIPSIAISSLKTSNNTLKKVTITLGTSIGDYAFSGCTSLTSITIPDSVTSIGNSAFYNCTSLTSITIPDSVTSIGNEAFLSCTSLTSITIPNSVISIGYNAFPLRQSLNYSIYDNAIYLGNETNPYLILVGTSLDTISSCNINNRTKLFCDNAFSNCTSLKSITIPEGVTSIGSSAFNYCWSLTSITIPNSVTRIGKRSFYCCYGLESITIPDSVTSIDDKAFLSCKSLTSITIPDSVTSIGNEAFSGCTSLISITIPDSVTSIQSYAFSNCTSLTSVKIPNSVTSIGEYAFCGCTSLTSITIPDSVTSIGSGAFVICTSLTLYCEATSKPDGWSDNWNPDNRPVEWGYISQ